ncbi:SDR family NAD(P)-dependent oxidoreductase [Saccharibacillus alkalitolerans]|uniref:SDR family NAD(P)-dependent oxidoreductase n=1 Tax=Saccharibacillus alkalitolerans TaxID=2705290 RepID=A0ABX0F9N9_9BACL|nr:SDR family NAD(P)-dependent oxidoreductase [Saccharibacillus alkalitolerans]NGZ76744.1 SDR family NAD(P)-dependent oxidoreductase [Saccharibacillus alkalitolerans]
MSAEANEKEGSGRTETRKVAIVTGTSSGFGLHICIELAKAGAVVAAGMRKPEAAERLAEAAAQADREAGMSGDSGISLSGRGLEPLGGGPVSGLIRPFALDVCDDARVTEAVRSVAETLGRIDILVNNAGMAMGGFIGDVPMDGWREQFAVNVFGLIAMTGAVLPYMREAGSGCILQMSSVSGAIGLPGYGPYVSSKFAIEGFSESLALETAPYGIRTYVIEPASYKTEIWEKGFSGIHRSSGSPNGPALERMLEMSRASAAGGGDPRDVARLAVGLALGRRGRGRFRYVVPRGAALLVALKKRLPFRLIQGIMLRILRRGMK